MTKKIGDWSIYPDEHLLARGEEGVSLEPRVMALLLYFAERPNQVLTRDTILNDVWQGQIVSDSALNWCVNQLRRALGESASNPSFIETIPKKGYRFLVSLEEHSDPKPKKMVFLLPPIMALLLGAILWDFNKFTPVQVSFEPFKIDCEHPEGEMYALGFMEALTQKLEQCDRIDLTRKERDSTFRISSNVKVEADLVRVAVHVFNRKSAEPLWFKETSFPKDCAHEVLTDLSSGVLATIDREPTFPRRDASVYEKYFRGRYHFHKRNPDDIEKALVLFEEVVKDDPEFALAYTGICDAYGLLQVWGNVQASDVLEARLEAVEKALTLEPELAEAYTSLGGVLFSKGEYEAAVSAYRKSLEMNPENPATHHWLGDSLRALKEFEQALACFQRALELDPFSPVVLLDKGVLLVQKGQVEQGIEIIQQALKLDPSFAGAYRNLAEVYQGNGQYELAKTSIQKAFELNPKNRRIMLLAYQLALTTADDQLKGHVREAWLNSFPTELQQLVWLECFTNGDFPCSGLQGSQSDWALEVKATSSYFLRGKAALHDLLNAFNQLENPSLALKLRLAWATEDTEFRKQLLVDAEKDLNSWLGPSLNKSYFEGMWYRLKGQNSDAQLIHQKLKDKGYQPAWLLDREPVWRDLVVL